MDAKKIIIASTSQSAGKTSLIVGLANVLKKSMGYVKPIGDRMLYRKKRLWDYDAALIANLFPQNDLPDNATLGFDHTKLKYMYDEVSLRNRLDELIAEAGRGKEIVFIEGGKDMIYGASVSLDVFSMAAFTGARLIFVISGSDNVIMDHLVFLKKRISLNDVNFAGVILNKIGNMEDFTETYLPAVKEMGINILGLVPFKKELTTFTVRYLLENLFAKTVSGEEHLDREVKGIFIGTMDVHSAMENPLFKQESKVVITSGDRTDMILAALETDTACVILTENIPPSAKVISVAKEKGIPLLLVPADTLQVTKKLDTMEYLLSKEEKGKISLLEELMRTHVNTQEVFS